MGLKIAQRLRESGVLNTSPTRSDTVSTEQGLTGEGFPTNRHIRQAQGVKEYSHEAALVSNEGMPAHFFDGGYHGFRFGDRDWIAGKLRRIRDPVEREKLAAEYSERYKSAHEAEPIGHRKDGKARFIANSWLLKATK